MCNVVQIAMVGKCILNGAGAAQDLITEVTWKWNVYIVGRGNTKVSKPTRTCIHVQVSKFLCKTFLELFTKFERKCKSYRSTCPSPSSGSDRSKSHSPVQDEGLPRWTGQMTLDYWLKDREQLDEPLLKEALNESENPSERYLIIVYTYEGLTSNI